MRPLRLELSGFTTFRDPSDAIDFSDAPYFALVGPTGSGKSSLIDAMVFALYGSVPRLGMHSVAPIIAQGKQEARVRLDFAIGDVVYTAVRVVRKTGTDQASTKEARLERGEDVIAGNADELTSEIERLLGLNFEQFTRCVVLPQGEFARFMNDKPAARQDLLVRLLGLDIYERMAQRANQRASAADATLGLQRTRLEQDLSTATEEELARVRAQVRALEELRARLDAEEETLVKLRETVRAARAERDAAMRASEALAGINVPADVAKVGTAEGEARALIAQLEEAAETAETTLRTAEEALMGLPDRVPLQRAIDAHDHIEGLDKQKAAASKELTKLRAVLQKAETAAAKAEQGAHGAQQTLEAARAQHSAHDLVRTLAAGEPCPVCAQKVKKVPAATAPADLTKAERAAENALSEHRDAETRRGTAAQDVAVKEALLDDIDKQIAVAKKAIKAFPDMAAARGHLSAIEASEKTSAGARTAASSARAKVTQARSALNQLAAKTSSARSLLDRVRDAVADLGSPPLGREDLAADWATLADWASEQIEARRAAAKAADDVASKAEAKGKALVESQKRACADAGIEDVRVPRDDCLKATERARGKESNIELQLETAKQLREEISGLEEQATVARALGQHLKASAFEEWVLRQALTTLTDAATQILLELSNGAYSLSIRNRNFTVIDHRNANMERSARTLSGGETFLASLALALALSDRIAQLSANTAVSLESIFLDEGFGTLDEETLDVVATALETLSTMNRVVGIVTHRRELAERVPVRFEVRKGAVTSTVEKVLA